MRRGVAAVVAVALLSGCAGSRPAAGQSSPARPAGAVEASPPAYKAADVKFADRMSGYLDGALALAAAARGRAGDPRVLELADGLRTVDQGAAQQVADWFRQWRKQPPKNPVAAARGWPGMSSAAAVNHLATLRGAAFDHAFLKLVIADQQGALGAATLEQETGDFASARQFAAQIVSSSALAIVRIRQLLKIVR